jgi:hypothetical protein
MILIDWLESLLSSLQGLGLVTAAEEDLSFQEKATRIEACLAQVPVNLWELRELALSKGGLLERE